MRVRDGPQSPAIVPRALCPACQLSDQVEFALSVSKGAAAAPLFPAQDGSCPTKYGMVETIKKAAELLELDLNTAAGAPAWGGHAMRRGGAQYLAASGIDVWRIQALARHSSHAILGYLDGIHANHLGNIAAEAELGRSLQGMREELRLLKSSASSAQAPDANALVALPPTQLQVATIPDEVVAAPPLPREQRPLPKGEYVYAQAPGAKVHIRRPTEPTRTWCNWQWTRQPKAQVSETTWDGKPMCIRCTACALKNDDLDSESSSSCSA